MKTWTREFLDLAAEVQALRFGRFTLKSGRQSPYFFNAGSFDSGGSLDRLCRCYASAIVDSGLEFDMLFGPAYKGIPLAAGISIALAREHGRDLPFAFDRKEPKAHGEGGRVVGAPLRGRVLIVDDVISAGVSIGQARALITEEGARPVAVAIALDRQEVGSAGTSAVEEVRRAGLEVVSVACLDDLIAWLDGGRSPEADTSAMLEYRRLYGA